MSGRRDAGDSARSGSTSSCRQTAQGCNRTGTIVAVEFLDGDDDTTLGADAEHFVNLEREADLVHEDHAANIDRMSRHPRCKIRFNRPGSHAFKLKLLPRRSNTSYEDTEKDRNDHFRYEWDEKDYTTDSDGTKIVTDMFTTAAGKSKYKLKATDSQGNEVRSHEIDAKRLIYYVTLPMEGVSYASSLATFRREMARHDIAMEGIQRWNMTHFPNVGEDRGPFERAARQAYNRTRARGREPYVLAVAFTDQLAVKNPDKPFESDVVEVGPGRNYPYTFGIRWRGLGRSDGLNDRYLWKNVVPGEDWWVSASFEPEGGGDEVPIPKDKCTPVPVSASRPDMCKQVDIDVSWLPEGSGVVKMTVNIVDRMRGGLAASGNLVVICTRSFWRTKSAASQNQVLIHEVGHQVGMAADGQGRKPDRTANQYTGHAHRGSHCSTGLSAAERGRSSYSGLSGSAGCVMFGATHSGTQFCSSCEPAVVKQDLENGWSRF